MKELIGHRCQCVFNLPFNDWPFHGYPAWVVIEQVDMPMIKMRSAHSDSGYGSHNKWVNAAHIQTISVADSVKTSQHSWYVRYLSGFLKDS